MRHDNVVWKYIFTRFGRGPLEHRRVKKTVKKLYPFQNCSFSLRYTTVKRHKGRKIRTAQVELGGIQVGRVEARRCVRQNQLYQHRVHPEETWRREGSAFQVKTCINQNST